ncbi:hypothetical protein M3583_23345, partial [Bacillus subtilis]|nr:hypothetical protein [Bacillus subtilis]
FITVRIHRRKAHSTGGYMNSSGQKSQVAQLRSAKDNTPPRRSVLQTLLDRILRRRRKNDKTIYPLF